jgi:hypothetical protein
MKRKKLEKKEAETEESWHRGGEEDAKKAEKTKKAKGEEMKENGENVMAKEMAAWRK